MADSLDALTQLHARGAFDHDIQSAVNDAHRRDEPVALVMADIDHFKRVNDTHGHQMGDSVLKTVASCLASSCRSKGTCFRYGGEELVVVLPNHSSNEAIAVAERARLAIERASTQGVTVTASFGVACLPADATDVVALIRAADTALYDAKNRGRNLVRAFGEPEPERPGPRVTERKVAEPGGLTDNQRKELRQSLLRQQVARCPLDGAVLEVRAWSPLGDPVRRFDICCPGCGLMETLTGDDS